MAKTFDPKKVLVYAFGKLITGYADGTFIKVSRETDTFSKQVGADGEVARSFSRNKSGSIEITLMQTSLSNTDLANVLAQDELTQNATGSVMVKDASSPQSFALAGEAWIKRQPDVEQGKEVGNRVWVIEAGNIEMFTGGVI